VIDASEGWFDPARDDDTDVSDVLETLQDQMQTETGLLLGRRTFESFRGFWPTQADDETGITEHLNYELT